MMDMNFGSVILMALMALIIIMIYRISKPNKMMKSKINKFSFHMNGNTQLKLSLGFIALLVVLTITVEIIGPLKKLAAPMPTVDAGFEANVYSFDSKLFNREKIDPSLLLEKRTHLAGETLTIQQNDSFEDQPFVYIERKNENDQEIEEYLYKPVLVVDNKDFSDFIKVEKPIWTENSVVIQKSRSDITHTTFQEATLLNQLTKNQSQQQNGFSTMSLSLIVHLKIPKDLKIIGNQENLIFIDDFD